MENETRETNGEPDAAPLVQPWDLETLRELIRLCRENDIAELKIKHRGVQIHIKGHVAGTPGEYAPAAPAGAPSLPPTAPPIAPPLVVESTPRARAEEEAEANLIVIRSPMVGTFYRSPAPDAASFVDMGDDVKENTVLCIVEAMKLMNEIKAETRGTVVKILVENGQPVEYNQPMFHIKPH